MSWVADRHTHSAPENTHTKWYFRVDTFYWRFFMANNLRLSIQSTKIVCNSQIPTLCDNHPKDLIFVDFGCGSYPCYIRSINIQPLHVRITQIEVYGLPELPKKTIRIEKKMERNEYCHLAIECFWIMSLLVLSCAIFISTMIYMVASVFFLRLLSMGQ